MKLERSTPVRLALLVLIGLLLPACGSDCGRCGGSGSPSSAEASRSCPDCSGHGIVGTGKQVRCGPCNGVGRRFGKDCRSCVGGKVSEGERCDRCEGRGKVCSACTGSGKG